MLNKQENQRHSFYHHQQETSPFSVAILLDKDYVYLGEIVTGRVLLRVMYKNTDSIPSSI